VTIIRLLTSQAAKRSRGCASAHLAGSALQCLLPAAVNQTFQSVDWMLCHASEVDLKYSNFESTSASSKRAAVNTTEDARAEVQSSVVYWETAPFHSSVLGNSTDEAALRAGSALRARRRSSAKPIQIGAPASCLGHSQPWHWSRGGPH
jgi:hypothetical protein